MSADVYDVVILGGGPGGYVAAIRGAQLGMRVALIDENQRMGGTCLRVGCIPSKALLESSHLLYETLHNLSGHGIQTSQVSLDLSAMMRRKDKVVDTLTGGINMLLKRNGVHTVVGRGMLTPERTIRVSGNNNVEITGRHILLAPGSLPQKLPNIEYDGDRIGDSTAALSYPDVPKRLVVIGGGYIGLELGSVWSRLGSDVIVLEALDRILSGVDVEIADHALRVFQKQGLAFHTNAWVESVRRLGEGCSVAVRGMESIQSDRVLVCAGRVPNTRSMGLENLAINTDRRGHIIVDQHFQTNVPDVFAIGDAIGGAMLAHKASEEGIACVEWIATGYGHVNYNAIPAVVYTHPEIAMVGKTEEQLRAEGVSYARGVCPFGANGRAHTLGCTDGKVKILADQKTDRILGVHAIGSRAGDLIAEAAVAINFGATSEDLARTCHAHPTLSELIMEAALNLSRRSLHT